MWRSRDTDPHPTAGADCFSSALPPPHPTHPSTQWSADPYRDHKEEEETPHRERAGTTRSEQLRGISRAKMEAHESTTR